MYKLKLGLIAAVCASSVLLTGCYTDTYHSPGYSNSQYRRTVVVPVYPRNDYRPHTYNDGGNPYRGTIDGNRYNQHPGYGNPGGNQYEGRIFNQNSGGNQYSN